MNATDSPESIDLNFETRARLEQHLDAVEEVLRRYQQPRAARSAIVDELENQIRESLAERVGDRDTTPDDLNALLAQMDPPEAYARNSIDLPPESIRTAFSFPDEPIESRFNMATLLGLAWWIWAAVALGITVALVNLQVQHIGDTLRIEGPDGNPIFDTTRRNKWAIETGWGMAVLIAFCIPGFLAPLSSSILGWVGVSQIKHSRGQQYGLGLAFAQAAILPIVGIAGLFCALIITPVALGTNLMYEHHRASGSRGADLIEIQSIAQGWVMAASALAILISLAVIFIVLRKMWRRITQPPKALD